MGHDRAAITVGHDRRAAITVGHNRAAITVGHDRAAIATLGTVVNLSSRELCLVVLLSNKEGNNCDGKGGRNYGLLPGRELDAAWLHDLVQHLES